MPREERTEKPTAKHRKRARDKGQVARSSDLSGSIVLVAGLMVSRSPASRSFRVWRARSAGYFADISTPNVASSAAGLNGLMHAALSTIALAVLPVAGACVAAALCRGRAGRLSPFHTCAETRLQADKPGLRTAQPARPALVFETIKAVVKIAVVGAAAALAILPGLPRSPPTWASRRCRSGRCSAAGPWKSPSMPRSRTS